jgi:hypothetical protein
MFRTADNEHAMPTRGHYALFTIIIVLLLLCSPVLSGAAPAQKIITSIHIDTSTSRIKMTIRSSADFTWRIERLKSPSTALGLYITPVEPDPQAPKEIPINSGLVKNIRIVQKEREKSLLIAIEVVSFPHYSIQEGGNHREITVTVDKEIMEGSGTTTPHKKESLHRYPLSDKKSRYHEFQICFDAAGGGSLKAPSPPLGVIVKKEPEKPPQSMRKSLSLIMRTGATRSGNQKSAGSEPQILHREFIRTDLVVILKFLATSMGLDLIASSYVKGARSIDISDMTAQEALPLVLRGTGYAYRISQKILLVGPPDILDAMPSEIPVSPGDEETEVVVLKKIRIEKVLIKLIKEFPDARFEAHRNLNALTITARPAILEKIESVLRDADREEAPPAKSHEGP